MFFTCAPVTLQLQSFLNSQQMILLIFIFYSLQLLAGSWKWWNIKEFDIHFLNSNFVFRKIFFSFEDLSMATEAEKMKYRTKYSNELMKQFLFVSNAFCLKWSPVQASLQRL